MGETTLHIIESDGSVRQKFRVEENPLYEIAEETGTSKLFHPCYMHAYWYHLKDLTNKKSLRLLEIGVDKGGSLRFWQRFLPYSSIFAIDCDSVIEYIPRGVQFFQGRQEDVEFLKQVIAETGGRFNIIVDDGSHKPSDQQCTLLALWPHLIPGGWYVVEDLETSYLEGYPPSDKTTIQVLKAHVDYLNREYLVKYSQVGLGSSLSRLAELHFYPNICFLRKGLYEYF